MSVKVPEKLSAFQMYNAIRERYQTLGDLKKSYADISAEFHALIAEMTYNEVSVETARKANRLRESAENLMREIKAIERCGVSIEDVVQVSRNKNNGSEPKKKFRDCVLQFAKQKGYDPFDPAQAAKFVAESRGQLLTNSVRVFTHRILKDFVLQNILTQVGHGMYLYNQNADCNSNVTLMGRVNGVSSAPSEQESVC